MKTVERERVREKKEGGGEEEEEEMVFHMDLLKMAAHWLLSCYRVTRKLRTYGFFYNRNSSSPSRAPSSSSLCCPSVSKCPLEGREEQSLVCDFHGALLRSSSPFPYFMLVAFEGGSLLRALLLLISSPLLFALGHHGEELRIRVMTFITFCGLRTKDMDLVARAVLPKFYLENLHHHAYEVLASTKKRRVALASMPRVMVEGFLKDYLSVDEVLAPELQVVNNGSYFTGLFTGAIKQKGFKNLFGDQAKADVGLVGSSSSLHDQHLILSNCKEAYSVSKGSIASDASTVLPRDKYPKPLVFHDGRLAFLPTPMATLFLFLWLPLAVPLSIIRILLGVLLPYRVSFIIGTFTGVRIHARGLTASNRTTTKNNDKSQGVLYVCSHRTLLDPVMLTAVLRRPVPAVTYSVSLLSELIAPMPTVRLTRDRDRDADTMKRLLREGDLVVCPEGTTCREPYLLRFSSLFAELAEEIVPVAVDVTVSMFYGTTASGHKWLDPLMFLMNPMPEYRLEFLDKVPREMTCAAGGQEPREVANRIQRQLGDALGFECTALTRRDKYMMLAGNEGVVRQLHHRRQ